MKYRSTINMDQHVRYLTSKLQSFYNAGYPEQHITDLFRQELEAIYKHGQDYYARVPYPGNGPHFTHNIEFDIVKQTKIDLFYGSVFSLK